MAKARALDKRRKSIRNIRKITRTMELIATARFKKAMDRAHAATAYTRRMTQLVADLAAGADEEDAHQGKVSRSARGRPRASAGLRSGSPSSGQSMPRAGSFHSSVFSYLGA